jgi:hypothetical protein
MENTDQPFSLLKSHFNDLKEPPKLEIQKYSDKDIIHFKNVIPKSDCKLVIDICEKYFNWDRATTFGNIEGYRATEMIPLTGVYGINPDTFRAHCILAYAFKLSFEDFKKNYVYEGAHGIQSHVYYESDEGFQILKYSPGDFYKEHIDGGMDLKRRYSTIMYLNDDYEGGETLFPRSDVSVKGEAGDVIYFPSAYTHPHIAQEIKSGTKYTAVIWSH